MNTLVRGLALAAALASLSAQAGGGLRVRLIDIMPDAESAPVSGVDVEDRLAPDVDLSWFFTPHFAAELVLTYPQRHDVTLNGSNIGSAKHLPPTLLAQYHPLTSGPVRPYLGAGINYTFFTDADLAGNLELERGSFGPALQLGADIPLGGGFVNVDLKRIWIDSDISAADGSYVTTLDIDPWVVGVGYGWRF